MESCSSRKFDSNLNLVHVLLLLLSIVAPEVALGLPYNESCDVYSFGIVLWQIMTLNTKTYGNSNRNNAIDFFVKNVWEGPHKRPSMTVKSRTVRRNFLPCLQKLVPSCWSHDWQSRPTMGQVESTLRDEVLQGSTMVSGAGGGLDCNVDGTHRTVR